MAIAIDSQSIGFGSTSADRSTYFGFDQSGIYVAGAHGNPGLEGVSGAIGGAIMFNVSDPQNPIKIFEHKMVLDSMAEDNFATCRIALIIGTPYVDGKLLCIWRRGDEEDSPGGLSGSMIFLFDIADSDDSNWGIDSGAWAVNHHFINTQVDNNNAGISNKIPMFSDAYVDGSTVIVFSQVSGVFRFNINNLGAGPLDSNNDQSSHQYETQGGCVLTQGPSSGLTVVGNYRFGLRVLSATLNDLPADAGIISPVNLEGVNIRVWDCVPSSDELFVFGAATSKGTAGQTNASGFQVYSFENPAAPFLVSTHLLPEADRDLWNGARDPACLRISQIDGFVFVSNMGKGYAIWDCRDPLSPIYMGTFFESLQASTFDTVSGSAVWRVGDDYFIAYGDGYQPSNTGSKQFYIDRVEGLKMTIDHIGNFKPTGTASGAVQSVVALNTRSMETTEVNGDRIYGPVIGTEGLMSAASWAVGSSASARDLVMCVYEATSSTDGSPTGPLLFTDSITIADAGALALREVATNHSLAGLNGKFLTMAVTATNAINVERDSNTVGTNTDRSESGGVGPDPWVNDGAAALIDLEIWYEVLIPSAKPVIITEYTDLINISGNSVNVDLRPNISEATSYVVTWEPEIPSGLSESNGIVSGTVTTPTGTAICTVEGVNTFGSVKESFQWTTLTTGNPSAGINLPINGA